MERRRKNKPRIRALPLSSPSVQSVCSVRMRRCRRRRQRRPIQMTLMILRCPPAALPVPAAGPTAPYGPRPPPPQRRGRRPRSDRDRPTAPLCLFSSPTRPPTHSLAHSVNGRLTSSHTDSGIQIAVVSIGSGTKESGSRKPITQGFGGPCECLDTRAVHSLSHRASDRLSRPSVRAFTHIKGSLHITPLHVREFRPSSLPPAAFFAGLPLFSVATPTRSPHSHAHQVRPSRIDDVPNPPDSLSATLSAHSLFRQ